MALATLRSIGHDCRYRLAAGYIEHGDSVLDAACGTGYGASFAPHARHWVGVDIASKIDPAYSKLGTWINADLCHWQPAEPFDVAISFETLEHVADPAALVRTLCQASRLVICSTPIVPTAGMNPEHLHDFTMFDVPNLFAQHGWQLHQVLIQPSELSGIFLFTP